MLSSYSTQWVDPICFLRQQNPYYVSTGQKLPWVHNICSQNKSHRISTRVVNGVKLIPWLLPCLLICLLTNLLTSFFGFLLPCLLSKLAELELDLLLNFLTILLALSLTCVLPFLLTCLLAYLFTFFCQSQLQLQL